MTASPLARPSSLPLLFLGPPVIAAVMGLPLAAGFIYDAAKDRQAVLSSPFACLLIGALMLGGLASPGYYRCWRRRENHLALSTLVRLWLRLSLIAAIISGVLGMLAGAVAIVPAILSLLYSVGAILLWVRLERND